MRGRDRLNFRMKTTRINLFPHVAHVTFPDMPANANPDVILQGDSETLEHIAGIIAKGIRFASRGAETVTVRKFDFNGKETTEK